MLFISRFSIRFLVYLPPGYIVIIIIVRLAPFQCIPAEWSVQCQLCGIVHSYTYERNYHAFMDHSIQCLNRKKRDKVIIIIFLTRVYVYMHTYTHTYIYHHNQMLSQTSLSSEALSQFYSY